VSPSRTPKIRPISRGWRAAEHGEGQDHDQQVQRPYHDRIGGQQGQHEPQPRLPDRQPQPVTDPRGRLLRTRLRRHRHRPEADDEQRGQQAEAGAHREHAADPCQRDQHSGQQAGRRGPGGFRPARHHVGRGQLIGGGGHRRDQRGLRRTSAGHRGRGDHGSGVGRQRRARTDRHGRARHRRGLRQVPPGEQDHRRPPVCGGGHHGGRQGGRHQLRHRD
jgi:hypothetical protein